MDDLSQLVRSPSLRIAGLVLIGAGIAVWLTVVLRIAWRRPVLPYRARRRVPWRGSDVLAVFLVFESPFLLGLLLRFLPGRETTGPTPPGAAKEVDVQHDVADLLLADSSATTWLLCLLVVVVVAPIVEEFTYRLLLQGWLEAEERRARRRIAALRSLPPGAGPVVLVSLLFALRHFRTAAPPIDPGLLVEALIVQAMISTFTLAFGLWLVRTRSGATAADVGFVREKLFADVGLGLLALGAVAAPILLLHVTTSLVFPKNVAADPIPLFFLALVLGTVYYRTHRIVPAIVLHMAFNATNLALFWLRVQAGVPGVSAAGL